MHNWSKYIFLTTVFFSTASQSSQSWAESFFDIKDDSFKLSLYGGPIESSHLGVFERFVLKKKASSGGSTPGTKKTGLDIYFPDGIIPKNADWKFRPEPGFEIGADFESRYFPALLKQPSRISVFYLQDKNRANVYSPQGVGIFIDPATIDLRTQLSGWGAMYHLAIFSNETHTARHTFYGGAGFFNYSSKSMAKINSAFLDVTITDTQHELRPLASLEYSYQPRVISIHADTNTLTPDKASINLKIFPTDQFITITATAAVAFEF